MALEPTPDTLLRLQTEFNIVKARHADLQTKVRLRQLVDLARLEASTIGRGHRVRDQLLTAPARYAAQLAAEEALEPALLNTALVSIVRGTLRGIAAGQSG